MSFARNASALMLNTAVGTGLAVLINVLGARALSPTEFGAVSAAVAGIALLVRVASLGLGASAQYHGAREAIENRSYGRALGWSVCLLASLTLVSLAVDRGGVIEWALGANAGRGDLLEALKWGAPLMLIHFVASLYVLGQKDIRAYLLLTSVPLFASVCFLTKGLLNREGLGGVTLAWQVQYVVSFLAGSYVLLRSSLLPAVDWGTAATSIFSFGGRSYAVFIAAFATTRIGLLIGAWFTTDYEVGHFATGRTFADSLLLIYSAIGPLVFSHVGGINDTETAHKFIGQVGRSSILLFVGCSLVIAAVAPLGMNFVFGAVYADGYVIVWWLLPGLVFSALQKILENYLYGRGKQGWLVMGHLFSITVAVGSGALLAPIWGAEGLAISSSLSCISSLGVTLAMVRYTDGVKAWDFLVPRGDDYRTMYRKCRSLGLDLRSWLSLRIFG
jgi:O-antigen/teichoic acid export membrane protein